MKRLSISERLDNTALEVTFPSGGKGYRWKKSYMDLRLKEQVVLCHAEDIAALIVFLGSPVTRQITGEIIRINGGR